MATNNNINRPSNFVILTLQAIAEGEMKYSASGKPWAVARAFLSQGKDQQTGDYKPSIFFDVKAFSKDTEASEIVSAISLIEKKERFTVKGRLAMREWIGNDDVKRQVMEIVASSIEEFHFDDDGGTGHGYRSAPAQNSAAGDNDEKYEYIDPDFVDNLEGEPA